jgi:hypothetical protein
MLRGASGLTKFRCALNTVRVPRDMAYRPISRALSTVVAALAADRIHWACATLRAATTRENDGVLCAARFAIACFNRKLIAHHGEISSALMASLAIPRTTL